MGSRLNLYGLVPESIVDGPGFRYTIFVQGCPHGCPGCHNPDSQAFCEGKVVDIEDLFEEIKENPLLRGVTFSGGEPFTQAAPLAELASMVKDLGLDVLTYTGFLYEDLLVSDDVGVRALLAETDFLIDGPFVLAERDLSLRFRGSRNQRVIDLRKSMARKGLVMVGV